MNKSASWLLLLAVAAFLGWTVKHGFDQLHPEAPSTIAEPAAAAEAPVTLDEHQSALADIQWAAPVAASLHPSLRAYGSVLDPAPLVQLQTDLRSAAVALKASTADHERMQQLFSHGQNVARSDLDKAEMQYSLDQEKLRNLQQRLLLEWGNQLAKAGPELTDALVQRKSVLIRVELLAPSNAKPVVARLATTEDAAETVETRNIQPDTRVNPVSQARSFLLIVDTPPQWLVPGQSVTAWLETDAPAQAGWTVPSRAITWQHGEASVYVKDGAGMKREPLSLIEPVGAGWVVTGRLTEDSVIAIKGAQVLLSQELKGLSTEE